MNTIQHYEKAIVKYAHSVERRTGGRVELDDALQMLKLELWRAESRYDPEKGTEQAYYMMTLATHSSRIIKLCTIREKREQKALAYWYNQVAQIQKDDTEEHIFSRDLIQFLPDNHLKRILSQYLDGYNLTEIAQQSHCSRQAVSRAYNNKIKQYARQYCGDAEVCCE